jgi:RNA polymerase sigma-70 factor (ECF subfamily)
MRIAYNMCVDQFRRAKRRTKVSATETFDIFDILESPDPNCEMSMMRDQTHDRVRYLVDQLPAEQREVVILRHYADMSFKEIAVLTDVSINTALGRMRYALINIRKMIAEKELVM